MIKLNQSKSIYLFIAFFVILGKTILTLFPIDHPILQMQLFNWGWMIAILLAGFVALHLATDAGFPQLWDKSIPNKKRFLIPLSLGLACAAIQIIFAIFLKFPNFNAPFPHSIPAYLAFGTLYEISFHLIPIVLITWLISTIILKEKYSQLIFLLAAVLLSLFEPYTQIRGLIAMEFINGFWVIISFTLLIFLANFIPLILFRKYGFLSMIFFRLTDYSVWHIIWPLVFYND